MARPLESTSTFSPILTTYTFFFLFFGPWPVVGRVAGGGLEGGWGRGGGGGVGGGGWGWWLGFGLTSGPLPLPFFPFFFCCSWRSPPSLPPPSPRVWVGLAAPGRGAPPRTRGGGVGFGPFCGGLAGEGGPAPGGPAPPPGKNRSPGFHKKERGPFNARWRRSDGGQSSERRGRRRHQGCNLRRLLASSECFREFRPRPQKSDPAPQHPRNLRNRMLRHLACQHSGGDGLQPGIMSGLKKPLPLRVGVPDQRLPTTAQANRLLEPCGLDGGVGLPNLPRPPRSFNPLGVHCKSQPQFKHAAMFKGNVFSWLRLT